jgi:murein DD-endopeptidase MepM/ murein hydrolase activator NlpD
VRGRIISKFGGKPNGLHNDGVNIAVPVGTSIKAAENGVVVYAGNELKGYGNLVLIRHSDNWVSAYAHNSTILVKRGDDVKRGQIIAKAGKSGMVNQPQLHFELRKGSKPVDPLNHMTSS